MLLLLVLSCKPDPVKPGPDDTGTPTDSTPTDSVPTDSTSTPPDPPAAFDRFCEGRVWTETLTEATVPASQGGYAGYLQDHEQWKKGTVEQSKVIPDHPFHVRTVRMQFAHGEGKARVRLMTTFGRSYPGGYPDLDTAGVNLIVPTEVDVKADGTDDLWIEVDVSDQGVFLEPTQHYAIVNEYPKKGAPTVGISRLVGGETSRALLILPDEETPYGLDGNFRMELVGDAFCTWEDAARWFEDREVPFADAVSPTTLSVDLDRDGHADVITYDGGPTAWRGDGAGGFTEWPDRWPEAMHASMMLFGDVDNDGDLDAFASNYVGADNDGDRVTIHEGDCDDTDPAVHAGATETTDGRDEDCDGVADDGTDPSDADADGRSIADGDCDDTDPATSPDAAELENGVDDDCDGVVDEDFPSLLLLNDGTATFTAVPDSGVETRDPTTTSAFGDADGDGFLDLYAGNWLEHYPDDAAVQDSYWTGNGDGTFTDALAAAGLELPTPWSSYGLEWTDYDNDGDADIFVGNYHLYDNQLWQNQGDGTFVDVAAQAGVAHDAVESPYPQYPGGHTYGGDWGDVDNDGDLDFYMANLAHPRTQPWGDPSMFVLNEGAPDWTFVEQREAMGLVYDEGDINAQFADFDNDMDLDLVIASLYQQHYARLYRNEDGFHFTDVTYEMGMVVEDAISVVWVDVDEDGDEDLLVGDRSGAPYLHLYVNRVGQDHHWVDLRLEGTTTNRDGAGARVSVTAGGVTQVRDQQLGNGSWNTQRPAGVHVGLGTNTAIDAVTVRWIGGATETFTGVGVDGRWRLVEGTGVATAD